MSVWMQHDHSLLLMIILDTRRIADKCRHLLTAGGHMGRTGASEHFPCYRSTTTFHQSKLYMPEGMTPYSQSLQHLSTHYLHKDSSSMRTRLSVSPNHHFPAAKKNQNPVSSNEESFPNTLPHHNNITTLS